MAEPATRKRNPHDAGDPAVSAQRLAATSSGAR